MRAAPSEKLVRLFSLARQLSHKRSPIEKFRIFGGAGSSLSSENLEDEMQKELSGIGEVDVGLPRSLPRHCAGYFHVHGGTATAYNCAVFTLPPHYALPFHDHEGMTVLLKVLRGKCRITSLDWTDESSRRLRSGSARVAADRIVGQQDGVQMVRPDLGNIHQITATGDGECAFLDVLVPAYRKESDCHYFECDSTEFPPESKVGLRQIAFPPNLDFESF
eukprot:gnl/Spiro4/2203_TR1062_c0_g1_i1.p1 gnl/Spiro4/2203_TR1062_c0_g1~~gnl/Spiro4/2203_TR1062_c0_g1_i1.p1  ORF type:complete len:220 (+),score=47.00 gnl/Spiro4/2203_TR1062_c0_g1_i1:71-730(+)